MEKQQQDQYTKQNKNIIQKAVYQVKKMTGVSTPRGRIKNVFSVAINGVDLAVMVASYNEIEDSYDVKDSIMCELRQARKIQQIQENTGKIFAPKYYGFRKDTDTLYTKKGTPYTKSKWYIVVEKLDGTLEELLTSHVSINVNDIKKQTTYIYKTAMENGICHGDPKLDNIMYKELHGKIKLYLIDFGQGCVDLCPDSNQVIQSLHHLIQQIS